ncbi:MAG: hypothetical protein GTO02_06175 [Candidatus Dadabacteria bacterium]|nr:hypothetical protein [Candidatus Dadabacteria bacterium]
MTINILIGRTDPDPNDGHTHEYSLRLSGRGVLKGGVTSTQNNHYHLISCLYETEKGLAIMEEFKEMDHVHTFDIMESEFIKNIIQTRDKELESKEMSKEV